MISQKATIYCLYEVLRKYSDPDHVLSVDMIRKRLMEMYHVDMERRSVYRNIKALRELGFEIEGYKNNHEGYYLESKQFEQHEVRLLCDAVSASVQIGGEETKRIISKLIDTQSIYEGRMIQRTLYMKDAKPNAAGRRLFYNIDMLNAAINQGCTVSATLLRKGYDMKLEEVSGGQLIFSPLMTIWADGIYYVLVKDSIEDELNHYRVDRLKDIRIMEERSDIMFGGLNPRDYIDRHILHKDAAKTQATLLCDKELWEVIAEVFAEVKVLTVMDAGLKVRVKDDEEKILGFCLSHMGTCELQYPADTREKLRSRVAEGYRKYIA